MVRLIIIFLLSLPVFAEEPTKELDDTNTSGASQLGDKSADEDDTITLSVLRDISAQLNVISKNLSPNQQTEETQAKNQSVSNSIGEADLIQQTRMALGTEQMAGIAGIALFTSFWGIFLLYRNLHEARRATQAAEAAARAAEQGVIESREIGQAELRAYLEIVGFSWSIPSDTESPCFSFSIGNVGKTPAIFPRFVIKASFHEGNDAKQPPITEIFALDFEDIRPGQERSVPGFTYQNLIIPRARFGEKYEGLILTNFTVAAFADDVFGKEIYACKKFTGFYVPSGSDSLARPQAFQISDEKGLFRKELDELRNFESMTKSIRSVVPMVPSVGVFSNLDAQEN